MRNFFLMLTLCFVFIGCKEKETATEESAQEPVNAVSENLKVNPAHGLPGHRCDLPVGAPLSGTKVEPDISELPSTSVSPVRIDKKPEVNPPHGQPYHDCSVPVGADLP